MRRYSEQSGFSLIEVVVVIAIMVILAGAVLGIGRRLREQANEKLCNSTIQILVAALEQYHNYHREFPVYNPRLVVAPGEIYSIEILYNRLHSLSSSRKLCEQIQVSQIGDTDVDPAGDLAPDGKFEFLDPWGNALDYITGSYDVATDIYVPWTFPEIVSGGPDGDLATTVDNISSK